MLKEGERLKTKSTFRIEVWVGGIEVLEGIEWRMRPQAEGLERKRECEATIKAEAVLVVGLNKSK